MEKNRTIDHIVYAVPNLEQAMDWLEDKAGIRPQFGGFHTTQGTKNALLNLGNACYLEILAADDDNEKYQTDRWMGIDLIKKPRITRWALKSNNLKKDQAILQSFSKKMGSITEGQRKTETGTFLKWEMILPLARPKVEITPFMVDWEQSTSHPCASLREGCTLTKIKFYHSNLNEMRLIFRELSLRSFEIQNSSTAKIQLEIATPKGVLILE